MSSGPNIIWITLDSIRADRTSVHGYDRETTPELERIAATSSGTAFDRCFSHAIWSQPSITSMLTGTYPSHHGAGLHNEVLPDDITSVATRFKRAGYRTACLSINPFCSEATGLDSGFDRFRSLFTPRDFLALDTAVPVLKFLRRIHTHSAGLSLDVSKHKQDYIVNELAKRWVTELSDGPEPFFMYAHYQGVHYPYYALKRWRERFMGESELSITEAQEFAYERTSNIYRELATGCQYSEDEWQALSDIYDAEVAYSDLLVGELFDHIQRVGAENTILVVTSDHGDLLGEHGLISHNLVTHDALLHVPMVVHGLSGCEDNADEVVQHMDVMQTLVNRAGASSEGMCGYDLGTESRPYAVSQRGAETCRRTFQRGQEYNPDFTHHPAVHDGLVTVLRTAEYKYQRSEDGAELFVPPDETVDVSEEHPEVVERFGEWYEEWMAEYGQPLEAEARAGHSESVKNRLEQLGYVME